ncbi:unnamed protein product [Phaedon cochleariae]|uniref:sn-1-specific diacylglycerol lipase ABHD11 n=1 Tax=Phaedon cochleariae TaxID=80249 RepID=A0A9N9SAH0_PHACE|nr:unnamed protein product [Phaedon cochleariae]
MMTKVSCSTLTSNFSYINVRMFFSKLKNSLSLKFSYPISTNIKLSVRHVSNTETLEPVKMSYASYESTVSEGHDQASPLIIMHGLFGSKSNWNSLCKAYNQKSNPPRKIIAIDARNHGDSPHNEHHSYAHLAADIKALFEQLSISKATLMGHSMGGRAVMLFALKYPELVDRLVVVDISPVTDSPNMNNLPDLFRALETVSLPTEVSMSQARILADSQLEKYISSKELRSFLLTNLVQRDNGRYDWRVNISALLKNYNNIAKFPLVNELQYDGPTLFLAGTNSDFVQ